MALRIVTLLPSATEIVCALGARNEIVGISHECDYPENINALPALTSPKINIKTSSGEIDKNVRAAAQPTLAIYNLDSAKLQSLAPDVIITQDLCDVCAVSYDEVCAAAKTIAGKDVKIVSLHPERFDDIFSDIQKVGAAIGRTAEAEQFIKESRARIATVKDRAARTSNRPAILTIEWLDPVMIGGTWMPEMVEICSATALITKPGEKAPTVDIKKLETLDPECVIIKPCGFDVERTLQELPLLQKNLPWFDWDAIMQARVYVCDGNAYFNRPGPRIVDSLEILAACIHPKQFRDFRQKYAKSVVEIQMDLTVKRWDDEYIGIE
ncbi:MAG: ABC transporter substrate-binding protein [Planctomycetota bacterium]